MCSSDLVGPFDAKTSPPASLFRSASLNTDRERRSLIGSALTLTSEKSQPVAAATNDQNSLWLASRRPARGGEVLKVQKSYPCPFGASRSSEHLSVSVSAGVAVEGATSSQCRNTIISKVRSIPEPTLTLTLTLATE